MYERELAEALTAIASALTDVSTNGGDLSTERFWNPLAKIESLAERFREMADYEPNPQLDAEARGQEVIGNPRSRPVRVQNHSV